MSFFGFNTNLPRDQGHPVNAPGFAQPADPFASLGRPGEQEEEDDDDALDFEETYDGLGDQLDETDDTFNDETFGGTGAGPGGESSGKKAVGKDFDFFGQTAQVSDALNEEHLRFARQQVPTKSHLVAAASPPKSTSKPARTGYEKYKEPGYIPDLQANASLWGVPSKKPVEAGAASQPYQPSAAMTPPPAPAPSRKMMSLEEVEAAMRAQSKKRSSTQELLRETHLAPPQAQAPPTEAPPYHPQILQRPHGMPPSTISGPSSYAPPATIGGPAPRAELPSIHPQHLPQTLQRPPSGSAPTDARLAAAAAPQPRQILQNPNRQGHRTRPSGSGPHELAPQTGRPPSMGHGPQQGPMGHAPQTLHLSEEERAAFLAEDAKRAKRNHKIYLLSKDNGLMTPQDKNFITRIQLQQLVTATGDPAQAGTDAALAEDFYYQVHRQIQGGPRQHPHQPLNHFAQTYLFQTGGRQGGAANRRLNRTGDNHLQRMEQQVQRAVEAAKLKPKNKQLVIEGSLGKISFSNAKTPKPLLNINRGASKEGAGRSRTVPQAGVGKSERKNTLRNIENVYSVLMQMENHERHLPPMPMEDSDPAMVQVHFEWRQKMQELNEQLWTNLKVTEPIIPNSPVPHPFIAILSFAKGKKAIPRIFRHIDSKQRVTILTMIVVHLGLLDVVRLAQLPAGEYQVPSAVREEVELFSQAVMPSLFGYVNEAPLNIVVGLLSILLDSTDVHVVARSKIGLSILTMFLSRAALMKQGGGVDEAEWQQWARLYDRLFDSLEPILGLIFPGSINSGEDMYVWQFLAAMGLCAGPEQQQRLVMAVKDRVMETVNQSKTLPAEMSTARLGNVNLFMRAIGLDVELLG